MSNKKELPFDLCKIAEALNSRVAKGGNIVDIMSVLWGEDDLPRAFRGGDWREVDFSGIDIRNFNFQNARLFKARFVSSKVAGADFRGVDIEDLAPPRHVTGKVGLSHAVDWQKAKLTKPQRDAITLRASRDGIATGHQRTMYGQELVESLLEKLPARRNPRDWVTLMRNANGYQAARSLLLDMTKYGYENNIFAYTTLCDKAKSNAERDDAREMLQFYTDAGGEYDLQLLTAIITVQPDYENAKQAFNAIRANGFTPDPSSYSAFLSQHVGHFSQALRLLDSMPAINVKNAYSLFEVADTFYQASQVIVKMHEAGFNIFKHYFINELIYRSTFPEVTEWRKRARQENMMTPRQIIASMLTECLPKSASAPIIDALGLKNS